MKRNFYVSGLILCLNRYVAVVLQLSPLKVTQVMLRKG